MEKLDNIEEKNKQCEKKVYVKPTLLDVDDLLGHCVPFSASICFTSSGR